MRKQLMLLFIPFLILMGCNKDDDQTQEQITPETFVKGQNEIISVSDNTIILSGNQNNIEANDIIVSGANDNAPYGFLRKVTSKSNSNGNTIIQTQRTTISEAVKYFYEEGEVHQGGINYTFQPTDFSGRNSRQNSSVPITISINETVTTNQGGVPIDINLTGSLTITPNIICEIEISNNFLSPSIDEFIFAFVIENNFNVNIETELNAAFDTNDIQLGSYTGAPITITVGIPIVIIPKFTLFIGANGDLNASILYTYNNNSTANAGISYNDGWQYLPENGFLINNQSATATSSVSGNLKAYVKPELSFSLYDDSFVSGGISVEPYARFEGAININEYSWLINGGVDTGAFFNAQAFGFTLVDEEWSNLINIPEWEIASGGYNIATITNPVPANSSTVTDLPISFSWQPNNFSVTPTYEIFLGTNSNTLNSIGMTNTASFTYSNALNNGTYYWKIIARDSNNEYITESSVFSFTLNQNSSTNPVNNPTPSDGETNVELSGSLSFTEGTNTPADATFKVYFDSTPDPTTTYNLDANTNTLNYSDLLEGTQYYWRVETISNSGTVLATSTIWSFTTLNNTGNTEPASNPIPNNGANNINLNGSLSFLAGTNTPTDATFNLYFDTNTNPSEQYNLGSQTSYGYSNLQENTTYYWKIETVSNSGEVLATSDVWSFTTINNSGTTEPASNPIPNNGANNINLNGSLSFLAGTNTPTDATFNLYFDTNTSPSAQYNLGSQTSYGYSNLQENTTYYWKIETVSNSGEVLATSDVWSFITINNSGTTEPASNPTPNNGANNISLSGNLSFLAGANTPTDATFNLYFDTNTNPSAQYNLGSQTSYSYSNLQENTTYYWKVETVSNTGTVLATSNVWSFTTEEQSCIFIGDVLLQSQQEIDDFGMQNYCEITGNLTIGRPFGNTTPTDISDLSPLNSLTQIGGSILRISSSPNLTSLGPGLENLNLTELNPDGIGVEVQIQNNSNLNSLSGFGNVSIYSLSISNNQSLTSLAGFENVSLKAITVNNCNSFTSFSGLNNSINNLDILNINNSNQLISLSGLENITVEVALVIENNISLSDYCALNPQSANASIFDIYGNAFNPTQQDILTGNCSQ